MIAQPASPASPATSTTSLPPDSRLPAGAPLPAVAPLPAESPLPPVDTLLVVDVQSAFVTGDGAVPDAARLVDRTAGLIARARAAGALVVHLQNDGPPGAEDEPHTPGWELHHPVEPGPTELVIRKPYDDGFEETALGAVLDGHGSRAVAVCGVMSEMCVRATARTALDRGHRVVVPYDGHATQDCPAVPGVADAVPAAVVSRVAAYSLGSDAEVTDPAAAVSFTAPSRPAAPAPAPSPSGVRGSAT
ncbi:isochorismatase family protein [Streptomyces sp. NPDC007863]|uniref:isochorismatase family protein n=1 Tax=Streptomyces sp. NPDC007863 TaxID=3154894 RepID=UPI0033C5DCDC